MAIKSMIHCITTGMLAPDVVYNRIGHFKPTLNVKSSGSIAISSTFSNSKLVLCDELGTNKNIFTNESRL